MTRDELEFSISQYHDGTLPPLEQRAVEEVLARDADARAILSEYQRLDSMLASDRSLALPSMDWDAVHARMSAALSNVEAPVKVLRFPAWARWSAIGAAVAAMLAIAIPMFVGRTGGTSSNGEAVLQVSVSGPSSASGAVAVANVSIGPSPELAGSNFAYDDSIAYRAARVVIAASEDSAQDGSSGSSPYQ